MYDSDTAPNQLHGAEFLLRTYRSLE